MTDHLNQSLSPRVAIVGGGISGLSAGFYLHRLAPQISFQLFEASSRVGGVIETLKTDDSLIELGADNFATLIPDALQLSREAGLEDQLVRPNQEHRLARVVARGRVLPIPSGFSLMQPTRLSAILTSQVLSWPGKLRLLAEYFVPSRTEESDESLEAFAVRRLGREVFERLVEPIVGGIFTAKASTLSMQAAMPQFVEEERKHGGLIRGFLAKRRDPNRGSEAARQASGARYDQFLAPKQGMQSWLQQLADRLPPGSLQLNTRIDRLERIHDSHGRRWLLQWTRQGESNRVGSSHADRFDAVIIATPSGPAAKLLQAVSSVLEEELQAIPYADSAVVAMVVDRSEIDPSLLCFGIVVPQIERLDVLAISFTSEKYPDRLPQDKILLRVFMGGAVRPELYSKSDDELIERAWHDTQHLLKLRTRPAWIRVVRWPAAMPQYLVGHLQRLARIEAELERLPGLALAGNAYRGVGIPQCVRSGRQAAEGVVRYLAG
jgi:protoporphyrinogen/coproporphyrinogen III oxidase